MTRRSLFHLLAGSLFGVAALSSSSVAATVQYKVTVDTTSISALPGLIELQFNQANALTSLSGSAVITGFASTGLMFDPATTGSSPGVTGGFTAPPLTIPNDASGLNYFDQGASKFGTGFSFLVTFTGPVSGGAAVDPSGFFVYLLDNSFNSLVATPNSSNEVANIILNANGSVSTAGSRFASVTSVATVPEPVSFLLLGTAALFIPIARRKRR